jgi:hypothetical protein
MAENGSRGALKPDLIGFFMAGPIDADQRPVLKSQAT